MAQITASFSERESANLTLMRLRRGGISFSLIEMTSAEKQSEVQSSLSYPICFGKLSSLVDTGVTYPQTENSVAQTKIKTEIKLSIKASQLEKAVEIMHSTGAENITCF